MVDLVYNSDKGKEKWMNEWTDDWKKKRTKKKHSDGPIFLKNHSNKKSSEFVLVHLSLDC